ncbi:MAG TPA: hypothetical protein VIF62_32150 [Labilithrix sp.]|jgi:hypothetical protein
MHRLTLGAIAVAALALAACGQKKPADSAKSDTNDDGGAAEKSAGGDDTSGSTDAKDGGADEPKKDECVGFDIGNVEDVLIKSSCEEKQAPDAIANVDVKGKLEVAATTSTPKVPGGGKVDIVVAFTNKSKDPITLHFKIDPLPRFSVEAYDKKGKRVDVPGGNPPPPPKDAKQAAPSDAKAAKLTIAPNGTARARLSWDAVKTKWAPEKYKGTPPEKGYPTKAAGALPKGKYQLHVITPLVGVFEGIDHEVSQPKIEIEVGDK